MNHLNRYKYRILSRLMIAMLLPGILATGCFTLISYKELFSIETAVILSLIVFLIVSIASFLYIYSTAIRPVKAIWEAIWHVDPNKSDSPAPKLNQLSFDKEILESLVNQVYNLASTNTSGQESTIVSSDNIMNSLPVGLFIIDSNNNLKLANKAGLSYLDKTSEVAIGKNMHDVLNLSFRSEDTLENWLKESQENTVINDKTWENVKLSTENSTKRFDISAHYSKSDSDGNELVLALFEKTSFYSVQDQATSYVAMAVHELRTPLTMLRGYIELFEEEIGEGLSEEHKGFMRKMSVTSQNLTAIVSNILNVSRIDENQFNLKLRESEWDKELKEIVDSLDLKAEVRGKKILVEIDENIPTVGIDKISMYEVIANLIDNAIKYSGQSTEIKIKVQLADDGKVETIVEDKGSGIPANVIGGLFTKFYRSHKSRDAIGGSGLGLYIVKSIVDAHGGNVWVRSKEGEGSKFGFTLVPYANLKEEIRTESSDGIERQANGWIKNHSLYRR